MTEITIQDNGDGTGTVTISGVPITPYVAPIVAPPSNPAPSAPTITGQTLTADKTEIHVGDTFTVSGVLNYSDGTTKPVTGYRLYGYDKSILVAKTSSTPTFMAIAAGATTIKNDNLGTTAKLDVTVLAADTAPPSDPPPADNPPPVSPPPPATSSVPTDVPSVIADGLSILYHYPMDATLAAAVDTVEIPGAFGGSPEVVQKIAWNFGDGSNGFGADGRHPYDKPGAYTITGSVNYRDGRIVPFGPLTVQVGSNA
jgi:hypothetical protein